MENCCKINSDLCCDLKNPLLRNGTGQIDRLDKALLPEFAKIDDRTADDLLSFAYRYSECVKYFDNNNNEAGDWQCFFDFDLGAFLAIISSENLDDIARRYQQLERDLLTDRAAFEDDGNTTINDNPDPKNFKQLIQFIYRQLAIGIQKRCESIPADHPFKNEIYEIIREDLVKAVLQNKVQSALVQLIGFDKGSIRPTGDYGMFIDCGTPAESCKSAWGLDQICYDCIFPDTSFDLGKLHDLFVTFFNAYTKIQLRAQYYFQKYLDEEDTHLPHIALLLTFLQLFKILQDEMNGLTAKHFKYYLEEVLCLERRREIPDQAHVIFELAKNFFQYKVDENDELLATKDDSGQDRFYKIIEELVVNPAQVAEIKTTFINKTNLLNSEDIDHFRVYASPTAKLADGIEEDFNTPDAVRWSALGGKLHSPGFSAPKAAIGFAISSPILQLSEGNRTISITLTFSSDLPEDASGSDLLQNKFRVELSTEEEWLAIPEQDDLLAGSGIEDQPHFEASMGTGTNNLLFTIHLDPTAPAIVPFKGTEDENPFAISYPMVRIFLDHPDQENYGYSFLRDLRLTNISLNVDVDDVRNLILENDQSILDPNKEFLPFGPTPVPGKSFYIGNQEVFSKALDRLDINWHWVNLPGETFADYYAEYIAELSGLNSSNLQISEFSYELAILNRREFETLVPDIGAASLFDDPTGDNIPEVEKVVGVAFSPPDNPDFPRQPELATFERLDRSKANRGFIRLKMDNQDFLHDQFSKVLTSISIQQANTGSSSADDLPNDPYTPTMMDISLDYVSTLDINLAEELDEYEKIFHLTPFGHREITPGEETGPIPFLPQFGTTEPLIQTGFEKKTVDTTPFRHPEEIETGEIALTPDDDLEEGPEFNPEGAFFGTFRRRSLGPSSSSGSTTFAKSISVDKVIQNFKFDLIKFSSPSFAIDIFNLISLVAPNLLETTLEEEAAAGVAPLARGNLYVGIKDLKSRQNLSLLFQVLEGSGNNEFAPPDIQWSFLVDNEWFEFAPFQILLDTTKPDETSKKSLVRSGIVKLAIPKEISNKHTTILNPEYHWIRASTLPATQLSDPPVSPEALPDLVDIRAQATIAEFDNRNNSLTHLATALEANSINQLLERQVDIKKVEQPFSSFGGKLPETDHEFYRRAAERLRHKDRGITVWDYERLVLEEYPDIDKVKCLNHTDMDNEVAPGNTTLAVIPNFENKNTFNPLEPRVPFGTLEAIKVFVREKTNIFVGCPGMLSVVNPLYERVRVVCCLRFKAGKDIEFHRYLLNKELKEHLAPWAYDPTVKLVFGSEMHRSVLLNFIEERDYVDIVSRFALLHYDSKNNLVPYFNEDGTEMAPAAVELLIPTTSRSILTSYQRSEDEKAAFGYDHIILITQQDGIGDSLCASCP